MLMIKQILIIIDDKLMKISHLKLNSYCFNLYKIKILNCSIMGNCNCLKSAPHESMFKSDVNVEGNIINHDKTNYVYDNDSPGSDKKNSERGVSNPTQNDIKKPIKKESSINIMTNNKSKQNDEKEVNKKESIIENNITDCSNILKKENSKEENLETFDKKESKRATVISKKLTELIKLKNISKINKDKKSINVVLLGDKCVGKTSIIFQYTLNKFDQYYITTIFKEDFRKPISVGNRNYSLYFTVTSGDPQYQGDYSNIYKSCDFFILVFDVSIPQSFEKIKEILNKEILQYVSLFKEDYANVLVVANKCDLKNRKVSLEEINEFCNKYCLDYHEVSAKNNLNIGKIFSKIAEVYDEVISN